MSDHVVLTFAEIEFLLRAREPVHVDVRELLGLAAGAAADQNAAAGLASLLARGLCVRTDDRVVPSEDLIGVIGAFATATRATKSLGWQGGNPVMVNLFAGPAVGMVVQPIGHGQYSVAPVDPAHDLTDQLVGFVDACLTDTTESAVLVRSGDVRIAVAITAAGDWHISDSVSNPDRSRPSTRDGAMARLRELLAVPA